MLYGKVHYPNTFSMYVVNVTRNSVYVTNATQLKLHTFSSNILHVQSISSTVMLISNTYVCHCCCCCVRVYLYNIPERYYTRVVQSPISDNITHIVWEHSI